MMMLSIESDPCRRAKKPANEEVGQMHERLAVGDFLDILAPLQIIVDIGACEHEYFRKNHQYHCDSKVQQLINAATSDTSERKLPKGYQYKQPQTSEAQALCGRRH